jgi:IS66 C-terminal element
VIASLIECCKLNSVDPCAYLADVLAKIVDGHLKSAIDDLLPWAYVASQPFKAVARKQRSDVRCQRLWRRFSPARLSSPKSSRTGGGGA